MALYINIQKTQSCLNTLSFLSISAEVAIFTFGHILEKLFEKLTFSHQLKPLKEFD